MAPGLSGTIKLGGADEYKRALSLIKQELREAGSALNAISSSFDNSDKSEQAVINTTERYNSVLDQQKSILSSLDGVYDGYSKLVISNKEKIAELTQKRDEEAAKLEEIKQKYGDSSVEYENQAKVVAGLQKQIDSENKSLDTNTKQMSSVKTTMYDTETAINKTTQQMNSLSDATEESTNETQKAANSGEDYKKSLDQIKMELSETGSELNAISSSFANSDKSEQDLANTTEQYNSVLEKQKSLYGLLDVEYGKYSDAVETNKKKLTELKSERDYEKSKLEDIKKTLGPTSSEYKKQKEIVAELNSKIDAENTELGKNEKELSRVKTTLNNAQTTINKTTKEMDSLGKETNEAGKEAKNASKDGFTVFKGTLSDLYSKYISRAIDAVGRLAKSIFNLGKNAVENFANYEQLIGGVETLFGESAGIVENYANNAYKSAGLSANQYMETITGFSASLMQSLGGDTAKVAEVGDMAVKDMADNANKMGTSMESIQNAYQGFAKQNYTMLDNLKLGYGGTKTEMERLLADAEKITGIHYDIGNLNDVFNAIHVIQGELKITGTTAMEAEKTIEGSINATKSAWQNLLTGLAQGGDLTPLIDNLVNSVLNLSKNLIPVVKNVISGLGTLASGLLSTVVPQIVETIPPLIEQTLPILIDSISTALEAILNVLLLYQNL